MKAARALAMRFSAIAAALFARAAAACGADVSPSPTSAPTNAPVAAAIDTPAPPAAAASTATSTPAPASASTSSQPSSDDGGARTLGAEYDDLEIVTLLGFDAIRAILEPEFVDAAQADEWLADDVPVIGVSINGDSRAYTVPMLSVHEIVNDVVGGVPVAVTW